MFSEQKGRDSTAGTCMAVINWKVWCELPFTTPKRIINIDNVCDKIQLYILPAFFFRNNLLQFLAADRLKNHFFYWIKKSLSPWCGVTTKYLHYTYTYNGKYVIYKGGHTYQFFLDIFFFFWCYAKNFSS